MVSAPWTFAVLLMCLPELVVLPDLHHLPINLFYLATISFEISVESFTDTTGTLTAGKIEVRLTRSLHEVYDTSCLELFVTCSHDVDVRSEEFGDVVLEIIEFVETVDEVDLYK
jgi:hypothetical protein